MGLFAGLLLAAAPVVLAGELEVAEASTANRVLDEVAEAIRLRTLEPASVVRKAGAKCSSASGPEQVVVGVLEGVASLQLTLERCGVARASLVVRSSDGSWSGPLGEAAARLFPAPAAPVIDNAAFAPTRAPEPGVPASAVLLLGTSLAAGAGAIVFGVMHNAERDSLAETRTWTPDEYRAERDTLPGILAPTLIGVAVTSAALAIVFLVSSRP